MATLTEFLKTALGDHFPADADTLAAMFAVDGVLECPYAPEGGMHQLIGSRAIVDYMQRLGPVQRSTSVTLLDSYRSADGQIVVLEYEGTVENGHDGTTYAQTYIAVAEAREGHLTLFREYWDPRPVTDSFGAKGPIALDELR